MWKIYGRPIEPDIEIPKKRIPWVKYFFQFLIPAFFISYRAAAQGKVKVVSNVTTESKVRQKTNKHNIRKPAKLILPELKLPNSSESLFPASEINSTAHNPTPISQTLSGYAGAVVITAGGVNATRCYSKKTTKSIPIFRKFFKDTAFSKFRVYPNPIRSNSILTIELSQKTIWRSSPSAVQPIGSIDTFKRYLYRRKSKTVYDEYAIDYFRKFLFETNR
jgi:hypothetical protein